MERKFSRRLRRALLLSAALLTLTAAEASAQQSSADPFAALPESDFVLVVDVQRALNEAAPRFLAGDPKTLAEMNTGIDGLKTLTGIDPRAVRRVIIAARDLSPQMSKDSFKGVFVVEGIDTEKLLSFMRTSKKGQYVEKDYQGQTVYTLSGTGKATKSADLDLAVLDSYTLALGSPAEVRASLDASAGRGPRVSAELVEAATRHPEALASVAFVVTPALKSLFTGGAAEPKEGDTASSMINNTLASFRLFRGAFGLTPSGYNASVAARLDTSERAKSLADMLNGLRTLKAMEAPKNEQDKLIQNLLRNTQVTSQNDEVQIQAEVSQADASALMKLGQGPTQEVAGDVSALAPKKAPAKKRTTRARRRTRRQ